MSKEDLETMLAAICIIMTCEDALHADVEEDNRDTVAQALEVAHNSLFSLYESLWEDYKEQEDFMDAQTEGDIDEAGEEMGG